MITNFEEITSELTARELELLPIIIQGLSTKTKSNPIKEPEIVSKMRNSGYKLSGERLRKIINHIRCHGLLPVIGTSKGYYVSYDKDEIFKQIKSLNQRANSIINSAKGLNKFI